MQVIINSELEQIIQVYLDSGKYQDPAEVLLAGLQSLQREESSPSKSFGILNPQNQFLPLTESEMVQESLKVLENYRQDGSSQSDVEVWANNLDGNRK
jgi:hypothetical protein